MSDGYCVASIHGGPEAAAFIMAAVKGMQIGAPDA